MSNKKKNAKNNAKPAEKKEAVAEKKNEKKYVNPILAWALVGCTLVAAICIGLAILLSL